MEDEASIPFYEPNPATPNLTENIAYHCEVFCEGLGLSFPTSQVAARIAEYMHRNLNLEDRRHRFAVSSALYIATHIMSEHRSLEEICRVSGMQAEDILRTYRQIYSFRGRLIQPNMPGVLRVDSLDDIFERLPAPNVENGFMDYEESGSDLEHYLIPADLRQLEELCDDCAGRLGHSASIQFICLQIAKDIRDERYLAGLSPVPIVAVSLYMVSHLLGIGTPIKQISEVVGISEGTVRNAYRSIYPVRDEILDYEMLEDIRGDRLARDLAWPSF